jgi:hypothetical protein
MNIFYTYAYLREDGTPYYIGKGKNDRAWSSHGKWSSVPQRERILFLKKDLTEEEAFKHEIYMINVFGRKDNGTGILRNRTNGGDGASGYKHKKSHIERMKIDNPMWKSGVKNKFIGKRHSEESINKMKKSKRKYIYTFICPEGNEYETDCSWEFCNERGLDASSITKVIKGKLKTHKGWVVTRESKATRMQRN